MLQAEYSPDFYVNDMFRWRILLAMVFFREDPVDRFVCTLPYGSSFCCQDVRSSFLNILQFLTLKSKGGRVRFTLLCRYVIGVN